MKRNYDYSLYKELGGDPERLPHVETYKDFNNKVKYQIFLYADALNWPEFRRLALIAAQAHYMQRDPLSEGYIERDAPPIAGSPYYKLEEEGDSFNLWVNIQCPNAAEYSAVKAVAESKIREIQRAKNRFGPSMWHTQVNADLMESRNAGGADEAVNSLLTAFGIATY